MRRFFKLVSIPILIIGVIIALVASAFVFKSNRDTEKFRGMMFAGSAINNFRYTLGNYGSISDSFSLAIEQTGGNIFDYTSVGNRVIEGKDAARYLVFMPDNGEASVFPSGDMTAIFSGEALDVINMGISTARTTQDSAITDLFKTEQGETAFAIVSPMYTNSSRQDDAYWGNLVVVIDLGTLIEESSLGVMRELNYDYRLEVVREAGNTETLLESSDFDAQGDELSVSVFNRQYSLDYVQKSKLSGFSEVILVFLFVLMLSFVVSISRGYVVSFKKMNDELTNANNKLTFAATKDPLTKLYNRRGGEEQVEKILESESTETASLIALDLDKFKGINDTYGHDAGDLALKTIAQDMKKAFGNNAVYIRNGGDEFIILVHGMADEEFNKRLKVFATSKHGFSYENNEIAFSISCGYSQFPVHGRKFRDLAKRADEALYNVKEGGRRGFARYGDAIPNRDL